MQLLWKKGTCAYSKNKGGQVHIDNMDLSPFFPLSFPINAYFWDRWMWDLRVFQ